MMIILEVTPGIKLGNEDYLANISKKLTLTAVQQMEDDQIIRDTELKGFGVRKRKGRPSYFLQTRVNGR